MKTFVTAAALAAWIATPAWAEHIDIQGSTGNDLLDATDGMGSAAGSDGSSSIQENQAPADQSSQGSANDSLGSQETQVPATSATGDSNNPETRIPDTQTESSPSQSPSNP